MKTTLMIIALGLVAGSAAAAQVAPEATGPGGLQATNRFHYALRYSEAAQFGGGSGSSQSGAVSGSIDYIGSNERYPLTLDYVGGYNFNISGTPYASGQFDRLFISQAFTNRKWKFVASDNVSYLPESPTVGFSGIPGIGEPIGTPSPAPPSSTQSILTLNTHAVDNNAYGQFSGFLTAKTTVQAGGGAEILRYPNGDGLDTDAYTANAGILQHLNGRDSISGNYTFTTYNYPGSAVSFGSSAVLVGYRHLWTRNLVTDIEAGPEWISSTVPTVVPSSTDIGVNASASYQLHFSSANVAYTRGANGGGGYLYGGQYDNVQGNLSHDFSQNLTIGLTGGDLRTSGLSSNGVTNAEFGGAQGTYRIGRDFIVFASYTAFTQNSSSSLPSNTLNQLDQGIAFGIGYSPRIGHLQAVNR